MLLSSAIAAGALQGLVSQPKRAALLVYLEKYTPPKRSPWYFSSPEGCWWDPDNLSHRLADLNRKADLDWSCAE